MPCFARNFSFCKIFAVHRNRINIAMAFVLTMIIGRLNKNETMN